MESDYLDWALAEFSGYLGVDELYDGPFCVLSIVDNRTFKRVFYQVLDHDPTRVDIVAFFRRFQAVLVARNLVVRGISPPMVPTCTRRPLPKSLATCSTRSVNFTFWPT